MMSESLFVYDGQMGQWTYTIDRVQALEGDFSASADIMLAGRRQCRLVLCLPKTTDGHGIDTLRARCVAWIEQAERDAQKNPPKRVSATARGEGLRRSGYPDV
ncbi:hypothetical protein J2W35_006855 [Variovorax boronicumulans]|nr:hypothetical protein [Variovorax boronicumulans]